MITPYARKHDVSSGYGLFLAREIHEDSG